MTVLDDDHVQHDDSSEPEVALAGGNMSQVVRRGQAVHRTAGPWTPTVHRLLDHLHANGVTWLPRPLGLDDQGREVLTYLPGTVPSYPMPSWVWSEDVLVGAGRRLAQIHQASAAFDTTDATWQLPAHTPAEVICLNDVAPYNMVFDDAHQLTGFIDVDTASPGPRAWDLAYLAYRLAPLSQFEDTGADPPSMAFRGSRLELLCRAYAEAGDQVPISRERCCTARSTDSRISLPSPQHAQPPAPLTSQTTSKATDPTPGGSTSTSRRCCRPAENAQRGRLAQGSLCVLRTTVLNEPARGLGGRRG